MEIHQLLFQLMLILLAARIFAEIASLIAIPPVIGEIVAGLILGPSLLNLFTATDVIRFLAEIGIILLLFEVGLNTDQSKLLRSGMKSTITAMGGFIFPLILGFSVSYYILDYDLLVSLFVGGALTATSIGITVRVLEGLGKQEHTLSQIVLGAAIIDDVLGVILLALLYETSLNNEISISNATQVALFIGIFFLLAPIAAKILSNYIQRFNSFTRLPGLIPTTVMSLVLFFAWIAQIFGAPLLLGGFAAGLALSRRFFLPFGLAIKNHPEFAREIDNQMKPLIRLFAPIFFVTIGLSIDTSVIHWGSVSIWFSFAIFFVIAIVGKLSGAMLIKAALHEKLAIGVAMIPRGEVGLIFIELGRMAEILNADIYMALLLVIIITTLLPPFILKWYFNNEQKWISPS